MLPSRKRNYFILLILLLGFLFLSFGAAAAPTFVNAARPDLPDVAQGVPMGGALTVFDLELDQVGNTSLELERFAVFDPNARLVVDGGYSVAPPTDAYFRGRVAGLPDSIVVVAIPEQGEPRGIITDDSGVWLLAGNSGHSAPGLANRKIDLETEIGGKPFACGNEQLNIDPAGLAAGEDEGEPVTGSLAPNVTHTARVAVETDYEYYALFNNVDAANQYMGDIFAYASTVYEREIDTNLTIGWSRLWTGGAAGDPWAATSGTDAALYELRDYWNGVTASDPDLPSERTITHMLSGKGLGGGIAYVGVLCNSSVGYGVSASLGGNFDINNPSVVWDVLVVTHEIGHNFNSSHTHNYCGTGGISDAVDLCYSSSSCGAAMGLPGVNSLTGGTAGAGNGTIMSYCHLVSGGYSNISFTFGKDHAYGVAASRVPDVMKAHVANRAAAYPSCLALEADGPLLTVNMDPNGTGSGRVTSDPAGIDCGVNCSASFDSGITVQLSAVADTGSEFIGWSGDCDGTGSVVMDADKNCTASFESLCGNGLLDAGEQCDGANLNGATCNGCVGTPTCTSSCTIDYGPCTNGVCEVGEDCTSCAADCASGSYGGAVCGNGVCEAGDGEDCVSCPDDCNGKQNGKPSGRFCCGDGDGVNPLSCSDPACGGAGACTDLPSQGATYCCGDGICEGPEDYDSCAVDNCAPPPVCGDGLCNGDETQGSCSEDCGEPPVTELICDDGSDNDFDGQTDCADSDCTGDPACAVTCEPKGAACTDGADCCSGKCNGKPGRKTCG